MKHPPLGYRPALDGLRALAVLAVVIYHGRSGWLPGGWLGVDLFFVLSGFLITSLLLSERTAWGRIDLLSFWAARARRLFPALALVLLTVLIAASYWTLPARRSAVSDDVLATMGYVANWRFLLGDEGYFASLASPSPLRHTWSLAVEEQFYILFPVILICLLAVIKSRKALIAGLFALAGLSALWMGHLYVPGVDPARIYYGTDTRAQELLVGAAFGAAMSTASRWRAGIDKFSRRIVVPAIILVLASFVWLNEGMRFVFQGGMFLFCIVASLLVVAAWSEQPTRVQRALSWEPLRRVGTISYGLYLWHWPIMVFLNADRVGIDGSLLFLLQVFLTFAMAYVSFRFIETPIRRNGFRSLMPSRPRISAAVASAAVIALFAGVLALPNASSYAAPAGSAGSNISVDMPEYKPGAKPVSVMLMGNSVPASVAETLPASSYPDIHLSSNAYIGCDPFSGLRVIDGVVDAPSAECVNWAKEWPKHIDAESPDLVALFVTQSLLLDRQVDGKLLAAGSPDYESFVDDSLDLIQDQISNSGGRGFALVNLSCHRLPTLSDSDEITRTNDDKDVQQLNGIVARWAGKHDVPVIDQYAFLCAGGFNDSVNGVPLYKDYMHFSDDSGSIFWKWFAPQLRDAQSKLSSPS